MNAQLGEIIVTIMLSVLILREASTANVILALVEMEPPKIV